MTKPRMFLGSSAGQAKLVESLAGCLDDVAQVEPWMTSFNPGTGTLERLVELTHEVDFAAFAFARDDWTSLDRVGTQETSGQASPRDNVVFEAGLFGGVLGMRRTFILHANGAKLPTDLLGLTCIRYDGSTTAEAMKSIAEKIRKAVEAEGRLANVEGWWWQFSLTERSKLEPSAIGLLKISRGRDGALELTGRAWQEDGRLSARYWSEAAKEKREPAGIFYYWNGERPLSADTPQLHGTGEIRLESPDRATGFWTTNANALVIARTSGVYLRAEADAPAIMDDRDAGKRAALLKQQLAEWEAIRNGS